MEGHCRLNPFHGFISGTGISAGPGRGIGAPSFLNSIRRWRRFNTWLMKDQRIYHELAPITNPLTTELDSGDGPGGGPYANPTVGSIRRRFEGELRLDPPKKSSTSWRGYSPGLLVPP